MIAIETAPRRDWLKVGATYNRSIAQKRALATHIDKLEWHALPIDDAPMMPGMAISAVIKEFRIPKVSFVAWNVVVLGRYGLIGIEGNYKNGRARIYALDRGSDIVPIAADFWSHD